MPDDQADLEACWPRLASAPHNITSPRCPGYNCVAWVADDMEHWWEPEERGGWHWPNGLPRDDFGLGNYIAAFQTLGFEACEDDSLVRGVEKIAIYVDERGGFTHVALQLDDGWWSSKLGKSNDISHERLDSLLGGRPIRYGENFVYMSRARTKPSRPRSGIIVVGR